MDIRARVSEDAVSFGRFRSLVGIVTQPSEGNEVHTAAVIFLNPGIVHRVGAGRTYVNLARDLADRGFLTLRFDLSGIGDSPVRCDNLQFEKSAISETRDAMDFLIQTRGAKDFILLGGCSGAKIAFETALCDQRVIGTLLINFPSEEHEDDSASEGLRGAYSYYRNCALLNARSWLRLLTGKADYTKLLRALATETSRRIRQTNAHEPTQFELNLKYLTDRKVHVSLICSEGDHRLEDLRAAGGNGLKQLCAVDKIALEIIRGSDHTFSSLDDQKRLISVLLAQADRIIEIRKPMRLLDRTLRQQTSSFSSALLLT